MKSQKQIDDTFLKRAERQGLLDAAKVGAVRQELRARRGREPGLSVQEVAVGQGWIDAETALRVLEELPARDVEQLRSRMRRSGLLRTVGTDTDRVPRAPSVNDTLPLSDDDFFDEAPRMVDTLSPEGVIVDSGDSVTGEDLQMELPPPNARSGDSLFDDGGADHTPGFEQGYFQDFTPSLNPTQERIDELIGDTGITPGLRRPRSAPSLEPAAGGNTSMGSDDAVQERIHITGADTHRYPGTDTDPGNRQGGSPKFDMRGTKGALDDFASYGDTHLLDDDVVAVEFSDDSEVISQVLSDSAVGEVMSQADDDYFGPAADLTHTPSEVLHDSLAPPVPLGESTLFDSESLKQELSDRFAHNEEEFVATVPPPPPAGTPTYDVESLPEPLEDSLDEQSFDPNDPQMIATEIDADPELADLTDVEEPEQVPEPAPQDDDTARDLQAEFDPAEEIPEDAAEFEAQELTDKEFSEDSEAESDEESYTLQDDFPTDMTVVDDSEVSLIDITGGEETGPASQTEYATGEGARPGLRNRTDSKLGVESGIPREELEGSELTLADLRAQMGIGSGVKIGDHTARLKKIAGTKRRYSVVREIARGGMGKVIEVEDNDLRRPVALKVLRKEMLDRRDLVERFLEEAQITGQLEHPNIVPVHEIGVDGRGNLYFTMKLVQGEDLASILKRLRKKDPGATKAWPLNRLIDVFIKVCEGAAFAHSREVIHRDLKPANIMVGRFGEVQIMDWGVAKLVGRKEDPAARAVVTDRQDDDSARTMIGAVLGTPSYMAPEQARGEVDKMGPEADIFSLGVILYEILCQKTPWDAKSSAEVLELVKKCEPQPPSLRAPDRKIPPELERLAMKCLVKDPAKRLRTATELIDNLRSWQEGRTLAAVEYTLGQLIGKWIARRKFALLTVLMVVAALAIGGVFASQAARQSSITQAHADIAAADEELKKAQLQYDRERFDDARDGAERAASMYRAAGFVLTGNAEDDDAASAGSANAAVLLNDIKKHEASMLEAERQEGVRQQFRRDLKQVLDDYRVAHDDSARSLVSIEESHTAFQSLQDRLLQLRNVKVPGLDEEQQVVEQTLGEIGAWLQGYSQRLQIARDIVRMQDFVEQAATKLQAAHAMADYDSSRRAYLETLSVCDQALAVSVPNDVPSGIELRARARTIKADAAIGAASRALQDKRLEIAEMWLVMAETTEQRQEQTAELRRQYEEMLREQSDFRTALSRAQLAVEARDWSAALNAIRVAQTDAQTSAFASQADREWLRQALHEALLGQVADQDRAAREQRDASALQAVMRRYDDLLRPDRTPDFTDAAFITRVETAREDLGLLLGDVLKHDADLALKRRDFRTAASLYSAANAWVKDLAVRAEIDKSLKSAQRELALAAVDQSDSAHLLAPGEFLVGSNREDDRNPLQTYTHDSHVLMDRYLVTNQDFKVFVDEGGYDDPRWWHADAVAMLAGGVFVDSTGKPGPATWADGRFDPSLEKYPVTGISWYEADAYARKNGKRLPSPEEWEIAAGAPGVNETAASVYPFHRVEAERKGIVAPRPVGAADWDTLPQAKCRDMGSNVSEWTNRHTPDGSVIVKGAEPGLHPDLFFHYARRAKNSFARLLERSEGRGFRCIEDFQVDNKDADAQGN